MTSPGAHAWQDLVDHLPAHELRGILRRLIGELEAAGMREGHAGQAGQTRRLSFIGIVEDEPDAARRSEEILRERFRQAT